MIAWAQRFVRALLWDEASFQRYLAVACYLIGSTLESGGVVPGTTEVIPGVQWLYQYGPLFKAAAFYLGAGGSLPFPTAKKNGQPAGP